MPGLFCSKISLVEIKLIHTVDLEYFYQHIPLTQIKKIPHSNTTQSVYILRLEINDI